MKLRKHRITSSINRRQRARLRRVRLRLALALGCLCVIAACGITVGTQPYISEKNVGPHSQSYTGPEPGSSSPAEGAQTHVWQRDPGHEATGIIQTARQQLGRPYRYGGYEPSGGFDCSGLIFWVYKQNGISMPRTAKAQAGFGTPVDKSGLRPGDIVAFKLGNTLHTGIYSGNGNFIHSPKSGDKVREESMNVSYWQKRFFGARRVL